MSQEIKKVGIVATGNISKGGGYPRVVYDLIKTLNQLGKEVYLLTPFKVDTDKIEQLYGKIEIKKIYNPGKIKEKFCVEDVFRRKLMKKEFVEMAKEVDFIFDICGRIMDKYIPKDFDRNKYVVWALTSMNKGEKIKVRNLSRNLKESVRRFLLSEKFLPKEDIKIYCVDDWTRNDLIEKSKLNPEELILYPAIQVEELLWKGDSKKDQIIVNGRIDPIKRIEDSVKIFALGTQEHPEYNLVIIGGTSSESEGYIKNLQGLFEELKIQDRVRMIPNPSFEKIKEELIGSKILIDAQRDVNLTMTSIEAMAAGNIILTYKNSSNYREILENGEYGYGFYTIEEGVRELKSVLNNPKLNAGNKLSMARSKDFSKEKFVDKIKQILGE